MHAIDFIYETIPHLYEGIETKPAKESDFCVCCNRPVRETAVPEDVCEVSIYSKLEIHCVPCQLLYQSNEKYLGIEGYRGRKIVFTNEASARVLNTLMQTMTDEKASVREKAAKSQEGHTVYPNEDKSIKETGEAHEVVINKGSPVIGKLGMLVGAGMAISKSKAVFYAPGKHFDKLKGLAPLFVIKQIGGFAMVNDVLDEFDGSEPYVFIRDFGKKKAQLVKNLNVSSGGRSLFACSSDGAMRINRKAYLALREYVNTNFEGKSKASIADFFRTIRSMAGGYTSVADAQEKLKDMPKIGELLRSLPICPHERIDLTTAVDKGL